MDNHYPKPQIFPKRSLQKSIHIKGAISSSQAKGNGPRSTQPPVAPAASRLQYGRRRNVNTLRERGHIELIEPILAIITVEK